MDYGGLATVTAMLPVSVASLVVIRHWAEGDQRAARLTDVKPPRWAATPGGLAPACASLLRLASMATTSARAGHQKTSGF